MDTLVKPESSETILLVHGTFAGDIADEGEAWWQRTSPFVSLITQLLNTNRPGQSYTCVADGRKTRVDPWWKCSSKVDESSGGPEAVFHWSGANSESARLAAGKLLLMKLDEHEKHGPYHVVAHSHGGSVLWEALREATKRHNRLPKVIGNPLPNLKSWTTLGSPFLHFRPDFKASRRSVLPLAAACVGCWWTGRWVFDYWNHRVESGERFPWLQGLLFVVAFYLTLFASFIVARLFRAVPRYVSIRSHKDATTEQKEGERQNMISCLLAFGVTSIVSGLFSWLAGWSVYNTVSQGSFSPLINTVGWATLSAAVLFILFKYTITPYSFYIKNKRNLGLHQKAWEGFGERSLIYAAVDTDEAINGLKAIQSPLLDPILPRIALSRSSTFRNIEIAPDEPEREITAQSFSGWIGSYLFLPITFIQDHIFRPAYNYLIAGVIDDYVRRQLHRAAHGCDIVGLTPHRVHSHPTEYYAPANQVLAPHCPLEVSKSLESKADEVFVRIASQIRKRLCYDYPNGGSVGDILKQSMKGAGLPLVHTSYYDNNDVVEAIAGRVLGNRVAYSVTLLVSEEAADTSVKPQVLLPPTVWENIWFWIAKGFKVSLLLILPLALFVYSLFSFYEYSNDYHISWAKDPRPVLSVANDLSSASSAENSSQTPVWVRWWIAQHLNGGGIGLDEFGMKIGDQRRRVIFYSVCAQKLILIGHNDNALKAMRLALSEGEQTAPASKEMQDHASIIAKALYYMKNIYVSLHYATFFASLPKGQVNGLFSSIEAMLIDLEMETNVRYFNATPEHLNRVRGLQTRVTTIDNFISYVQTIGNKVTAMQLLAAVLAHVELPLEAQVAIDEEMKKLSMSYIDYYMKLGSTDKATQAHLSIRKVVGSSLASAAGVQSDDTSRQLFLIADQLTRECELILPNNQQKILIVSRMQSQNLRSRVYRRYETSDHDVSKSVDGTLRSTVTEDSKELDDIVVSLNAVSGRFYKSRIMSEYRSPRARVSAMLGILECELVNQSSDKPIMRQKLRYLLAEDLYQ